VLLLPEEAATGSAAPEEGCRRWFQVVFKPRIILRSMPRVESCGVATASAGEVLEAEALQDGWVRMTVREAASRGVVRGDEAWALIDGRARGLGALLQPCLPRWFRVLFEPRIALFGIPEHGKSGQAPVVGTVAAGDGFEVVEASGSWVRLASADAVRLGVPAGRDAWALVDGHARGLGELLAPCTGPPEPGWQGGDAQRPGALALAEFRVGSPQDSSLRRWEPGPEEFAKASAGEEEQETQLAIPPEAIYNFEEEEAGLELFFERQEPMADAGGQTALQAYSGLHWGSDYDAALDGALVPIEVVVAAAEEAANVPDPAWPVPEPLFL